MNLNGGLYLSHTGEPVSAPHTSPPQQTDCEWHGERNITLPTSFAINVKLAAAWRALALADVGFTSHLELEAQLVTSLRHRDVRFNVIELAADVVVDIVEFAALHVEGKAAV